ncbi:MAG: hypothetical protein ACI87O_000684 [Planctomycetota bacterium]|jgi:hypothetical protein
MQNLSLLSITSLFLLALPLHAQAVQSGDSLQRKQVSAPASDILSRMVRLPDRWQNPESIRGSLLEFESDGKNAQVSFWAPEGETSIVPIWTEAPTDSWQFQIGGGEWLHWKRLMDLGLGSHEQVLPTDNWTAMSPERLTLHIPKATQVSIRAPHKQATHVIIGDQVPATLKHGLSTYRLQQGQPIAIRAKLESVGETCSILSAHVKLQSSQETQSVRMYDDGQHLDLNAGDGVWGAAVPQGWLGEITATTHIIASNDRRQRFSRTGVQTFRISPKSVQFTGQVQVSNDLSDAWTIALPAHVATRLPYLHFAAEIWGTDSKGQAQPICWLARQCAVSQSDAATDLSLELDRRWLLEGDLQAPFELRHVRVQDPNTWTVLAEQDHFALPMPLPTGRSTTNQSASSTGLTFRVSAPPPTTISPANQANAQTTQPLFGLMLVHGWCSSPIWPAAQFTQPLLVHQDTSANRSHDEFAQLLATLGSSKRSFGVVAHSQGGAAALHLRTFYVSGLDRAQGGRAIQSLATPYQGTPLAGLGFFLCGSNTDLSTAGSAAWLANIPSSVRDEVYYYTTANSGSACNFLTNAFLTNPEDGTVEQFRGQLPGAHNMGHVTGWCHTTGMTNPAGYHDAARNAIMNQEAAH